MLSLTDRMQRLMDASHFWGEGKLQSAAATEYFAEQNPEAKISEVLAKMIKLDVSDSKLPSSVLRIAFKLRGEMEESLYTALLDFAYRDTTGRVSSLINKYSLQEPVDPRLP